MLWSLKNLKTGLIWGLRYAFAYSLIVLVIAVTRGAEPFQKAGTTLLAVLVVYWSAGVVTGSIVGILLPLGKSMAGAALLGAIGSIPVSCAVLLATQPPSHWGAELPLFVVIGLLIGPLFGLATKLPLAR